MKKLTEKPPATKLPNNRCTQQKQPESTAGGNTRRKVNQVVLNRGGSLREQEALDEVKERS